jgi:hypothetical protein
MQQDERQGELKPAAHVRTHVRQVSLAHWHGVVQGEARLV